MRPAFYLRALVRESRRARGRLTFFVACLAVGVTAVVAVAGISASLDEGIRMEARQLLGADLAVRGSRPLPPDFDFGVAGLPLRTTQVKETVTVVSAPPDAQGRPGRSQLVELKAVAGEYPFYGKLVLRPARPLAALLDAESAVVAVELLSRLHLRIGDALRIGGQSFRIAGVVLSEPDRISVSLTLGPRVFVAAAGLARTTLEGLGSRFTYRTLIQVPAGTSGAALQAAAERLKEHLPSPTMFFRVESYRDAQPALRDNLARIERFLGLVALLSLFVGGIGVAQSVRAWISGRLDAIAVLKCLGMRPRELFLLYLGQAALLGVAGSLVGIAAGSGLQALLPRLFPELIPAELLRAWQPAALLRGLGLGVGVAILFSLPPLSAVLRVPPVRVLRREAEPLPIHRWTAAATLAALAAGIFGFATLQSRSWLLGAQFTGGVAFAAAALSLGALAITRAVRRLPRRFARLPLRHGLAALARPGAATLSAIVALGLGVLVVLAMSLVERRLSRQFTRELPADAPNVFLIDIQPDQWPGVRQLLARARARRIESVPVITARLVAIDGVGAEQLVQRQRSARRTGDGRGGHRWVLTREQRLTSLAALPADNEIVAGRLWSDPGRAEASVEKSFADDLGVRLGSVLRWDIEGVPFDLTVTSIRTVNWRSFGINFSVVVKPGVLDQAPQQRFAAARIAPGGEQRLQDLLAASYPNITLLRIRDVLERVLTVLNRIAVGVRFLGAFTVLAGIAILAGAVAAGSVRRGREVALLKTLGLTRRGVASSFAVEYALVGLVAGAIGAAAGALLAWGVITRGFNLAPELEPLPVGAAVVASVFLTVIAGLAASLRALERRPIEVLRNE
ncbi:MAG TPA: FtsX-like permease family protein [Thermoanaerobaculia bacterium]|nr:FtsX-like permease family protein [Thermoanaerobaculia bacterium]